MSHVGPCNGNCRKGRYRRRWKTMVGIVLVIIGATLYNVAVVTHTAMVWEELVWPWVIVGLMIFSLWEDTR